MIGQDYHEFQEEKRANTLGKISAVENLNLLIPVGGSQMDVKTLEKSITDRVRNEVDNRMVKVDTIVHDVILAAMDGLVTPRVELAKKPVNASSRCNRGSVVLDSDQRGFPENAEGLQMTTSSRLISNINVSRIDETRGNFIV